MIECILRRKPECPLLVKRDSFNPWQHHCHVDTRKYTELDGSIKFDLKDTVTDKALDFWLKLHTKDF